MSGQREICIELAAGLSEEVSARLIELGAEGAWVEDDETRSLPDRPAEPTGRALVRAAFEPAEGLEARVLAQLQDLLQHLPGGSEVEIRWADLAAQDWNETWKSQWGVQHLGERLVIVPSWESYQAQPDELILDMDPGMAFGTGTHATTQLCVAAIERCLQPGQGLLDVGTGTGVLAMHAARLGARPVLAIDNDPDAVAVARQNALRNALERVVRFAVSAEVGVAGLYPVVVANILMQPLIDLAEAIAARVAPGGTLLLSGLLVEQLDAVAKAYRARGMLEQRRDQQGEWGLLELRSAR